MRAVAPGSINGFLTRRGYRWGMRYWLFLLILLAGCETGRPAMMGALKHEITLDGIRFVVFQKGDQAEVLRMGYLTRAERAPVPALMEQAAAMATGCAVIPGSRRSGLPGGAIDTGEAMFDLRC